MGNRSFQMNAMQSEDIVAHTQETDVDVTEFEYVRRG